MRGGGPRLYVFHEEPLPDSEAANAYEVLVDFLQALDTLSLHSITRSLPSNGHLCESI